MATAIRERNRESGIRETRRLIAAVSYLRMSTDEQDNSIPKQREEIERYAAQNGYKIIREYKDEAKRGDDENREDFVRMVKDVQTIRDFEAIIVWNQKRFARMSFLKTAKYWDALDEAEIKLISVRDGGLISFDEIGPMLTAVIKQNDAHAFSIDLGAEICTQSIKTALNGHNPGGKPPYGYSSVPATDDPKGPRKYAVDDSRAAVVRQIFRWFVDEGHSFRGIADRLNKSGAPSPARNWRVDRGEAWIWYNVKAILKNEKYTGAMVHGKMACGKYYRRAGDVAERVGKRERMKKQAVDRSQWLVVPNSHEAIIDCVLFTRAQALMDNRKKSHRRAATISPLSGLCRCGHCQSKMVTYRKSATDSWRGLRCNTMSQNTAAKAECRCYVNLNDLSARILAKIEREYLSDAMLTIYRQEISDYLLDQRKHSAKSRSRIEKDLSAINAKLTKAESRVLDVPEHIAPTLYRQIGELQLAKQKATAELAVQSQLFEISERVIADQGQALVNRLKQIRSMLQSQDSATVQAGLEQVIDSVIVWTRPIAERRPGRGFNAKRELDRYAISYKSPISILENSACDTLLNTYLPAMKLTGKLAACKVEVQCGPPIAPRNAIAAR